MFRGSGFGRPAGRGSARSVLATLASMALLLSLAGPAAAHEPYFTLSCEGGLKVDLLWYNGSNTVDVQIDGVAVDGSPFTFSDEYHGTWPVLPATAAHTAKVVVWAHDDPQGVEGWSRTWTGEIGACQKATPTPDPTPVVTPTPTGTVEAETGTPRPTRTPRVTPPSTDGLPGEGGGPGTGLPLVLILLAGSSLALLPGSRKRARR